MPPLLCFELNFSPPPPPWQPVATHTAQVFIGSSAIVNQTVSGDEIVTAYSDSDCGSQYVEVQPACRDCEDAAGSVAVTTIISFLANIGSVCSAARCVLVCAHACACVRVCVCVSVCVVLPPCTLRLLRECRTLGI